VGATAVISLLRTDQTEISFLASKPIDNSLEAMVVNLSLEYELASDLTVVGPDLIDLSVVELPYERIENGELYSSISIDAVDRSFTNLYHVPPSSEARFGLLSISDESRTPLTSEVSNQAVSSSFTALPTENPPRINSVKSSDINGVQRASRLLFRAVISLASALSCRSERLLSHPPLSELMATFLIRCC